jgi:acetoin utilization deacetylase AcuC-like enzyme
MFSVAWSPQYNHPLPEGHRFPMIKYDLLPEQLLREGTLQEAQLFKPTIMPEAIYLKAHTEEYLIKLNSLNLSKQEERKTGFPLSEPLVHREKLIMSGSIECGLSAMADGISLNIAGGTHHAYTEHGEGFCLLNDIALCSRYLLDNRKVSKVLVVDLDVHQGNGTAEIFRNDERVFTFSMHGASNYPMFKETSDLDIPLPDQTDDATYLKILSETLPKLIDEVKPDFICYQSGVDVLATDKIGRLGLSLEGCKERDNIVFRHFKQNKIPVMVSMGGGYSEDIRHILEAHSNTFRLASWYYS